MRSAIVSQHQIIIVIILILIIIIIIIIIIIDENHAKKAPLRPETTHNKLTSKSFLI